MKKTAFKFKSGSGTILAFLILAFVFASIAGVVYIVVAQGPGKAPQAAGSYQASSLRVANQSTCTSTGKVNISFSWVPGQQAGFMVRERQLLDLSLANDNFGGVHLTASNPPSKDATSYMTGQGQIGQLDAGKTYFWRINTHYLNENWHPSATATFTTMPCQQNGSWTLNQPIVGGNSVSFSFSPASNGQISLIVKKADTSTIVFDSGLIANGKTSVGPQNMLSGNYQAVLVFATAAVSNTVSFSVNGILQSPTPKPIVCTFTNSAGKVQKYGDVNNNTYVNSGDATLVKRSVAGIDPAMTGDAKKAADVNGDGAITTADADLINQFYFKVITSFPVCSAVTLPIVKD